MNDSSERLQQLKSRLLETEILAQFGGNLVSPEAAEFISGLMKQWYSIDNDGQFVTNSEMPLSTVDLRPTPVDQIGSYLKAKHPYLFRENDTPGASSATTVAPSPPNKAEMSLEEKCRFIRLNGEQAYQDLPSNPVEALPLAERPRSTWTVEERARFIREHGQDAYLSLPA